ncbi:MAG TPA: hypothetical protein VJ777_13530 [Mycobacterium sp.]|nr:hypothetical protein [Mycobacterium sp.]
MKVYVAIVELKYDVLAVAYSKSEAVQLACLKAFDFLKKAGAITDETDTPEKVRAWFGVTVTGCEVGQAAMVGDV